MNKDIKLKFGKYKGQTLENTPDSYLKWAVANNVLKGRAMLYAKQRINYPKDDYEVVVTDAVVGDGKYIVKAHTSDEAIQIVVKTNKIRITQSFCGTSFTVTKINN